jgi:predicted nucleic acid-binding Zn ribbon protein
MLQSSIEPFLSHACLSFSLNKDHVQTMYLTQTRLCEQLRQEARRERTKVSLACKDLVFYVTDHQSSDVLVTGFSSTKDNPLRDKQQCVLL